jgi:hypothetical protein
MSAIVIHCTLGIEEKRVYMSFLRSVKKKAAYIVTSAVLLVGVLAPGFISTYASAASVTTKSIALSSSSISATGVTYTVNFTPVSTEGAFAVNFCTESTEPTDSCTAPAGFSAASASTTTSGFTATGTTGQFIVGGTLTAATPVSVAVDGITNPSVTTPLYARITTYTDTAAAAADTTPVPGAGGVDHGGVVIAITNTIGVSGAVLETMTFCVAKAVITQDCGNAAANPPTLQLGETVGSTVALDTGHISTGTLHTQISTNAATGAVINLKSATDCGGLKRAGASVCDIAPAGTTDLVAGHATFGVKLGTAAATSGDTDANGTLEAVSGSHYNNSTYALNYASDSSSGVTSPFGDPFLDTNNAPINNENMDFTFGASISNTTPAGNYSTSLSLIATGKF